MEQETTNALAGFFTKGGWYMYVIAAIGVVATGTIIERAYRIFFFFSVNGTAFMGQIQKLVMADQIEKAIKMCNAESEAALARVLKAGLQRANRGPVEIQNAVDETSLEVIPELEKRTPFLSMWANVATLTGLLGTIAGLIKAFAGVAAAAAADKQRILAEGISQAMYTTLFGLITAIPILIAHSFIQNKTAKLVKDLDLFSVRLINLLSARYKGTLNDEAA